MRIWSRQRHVTSSTIVLSLYTQCFSKAVMDAGSTKRMVLYGCSSCSFLDCGWVRASPYLWYSLFLWRPWTPCSCGPL